LARSSDLEASKPSHALKPPSPNYNTNSPSNNAGTEPGGPPRRRTRPATPALTGGWRLRKKPSAGGQIVTAMGRMVGVSIGDDLLEERRRRRRAGDPRITPEGRAILLRLVTGDLMGEFQAELDRISAEDPILSGEPETQD
jgi:hypothetical protein